MKIGFIGLLGLLFIGLKLGGVIAWSWLWVLSPLWLPISVALCSCTSSNDYRRCYGRTAV